MLHAIWVKNQCIALQKSNFCQNLMSLKNIALDRELICVALRPNKYIYIYIYIFIYIYIYIYIYSILNMCQKLIQGFSYLINPKVRHVYFNFTLKYLDSNAKLFDPKLLFCLGSTNHSNIFLILLSFDVLRSKPSLCVYTQ